MIGEEFESFTTLMFQAPTTMKHYLIEGVKSIDEVLGRDYAKEHPLLLAAFILGCTFDYGTAVCLKFNYEWADLRGCLDADAD